MTDPQSEHITGIIDEASSDLWDKYRIGTEEHPGLLSEMPLLDLAENSKFEILDLINYHYTFMKKLKIYLKDPLIQMRMAEIDRLEALVKERKDV